MCTWRRPLRVRQAREGQVTTWKAVSAGHYLTKGLRSSHEKSQNSAGRETMTTQLKNRREV